MRLFGLVLVLVLIASPAEAQRKKKCNSAMPDSALMLGGPVYRECDVDKIATRVGIDPRINWQPSSSAARSTSPCNITEFRFVVDTSGRVEPASIEVVRADNRDFTEAVRQSLNELRYKPAIRDSVPVRQLVTYRRTLAVMVTTVVTSGSMAGGPPPAPSPGAVRCR